MPGLSDAELVRQALDGRPGAYGDLVRRWAASVAACCQAHVRDGDAVQDLAQETLLRGFAALPSLERPEHFGAWLRGIARATCLDWIKRRRRARRTFRELGDDMADERTGAGGGVGAEATAELLREVERLPEAYRETLLLYYYNDLTYEALGEMLGVSAATVNARLTKARAMLRERLSGREGGDGM